MKRIAILVIAATNQPVYVHYIDHYWTALIRHCAREKAHIDTFLLFEHREETSRFDTIRDYVIRDPRADLSDLCRREFQSISVPGILSKTLHALELLQDRYDVFFRTNLSSVIKLSAFDDFVQHKDGIRYSGAFVWNDALRQDLLHHDRVGPGKSIESLAELEDYEGNTFISGSGYFLNADEARSLVARRDRIRYDIADDVSVGLMFARHELLPGFTLTLRPNTAIPEIIMRMRRSESCHFRLEHFPLERAEALWQALEHERLWK